MKKFLISSIIFPILILIAAACAPARTVTSEPIETVTSPTQTLEAPATATDLPPTPENTPLPPTPDTSYHINTDPNSITGPSLTLEDTKGKLTAWAKNQPECKNPSIDNPKEVNIEWVYDSGAPFDYNILQPRANIVNGAYVQPKVSEICSYHKINPSVFGFSGKNDIFLITQNLEDSKGNLGVWQIIDGEAGIKSRQKYSNTEYFPYDRLIDPINKRLLPDSGEVNGPDDNRDMGTNEVFYTSQGTNLEEVREAFQVFAEGGYDAPFPHSYIDKDGNEQQYKNVREYIESHVFR